MSFEPVIASFHKEIRSFIAESEALRKSLAPEKVYQLHKQLNALLYNEAYAKNSEIQKYLKLTQPGIQRLEQDLTHLESRIKIGRDMPDTLDYVGLANRIRSAVIGHWNDDQSVKSVIQKIVNNEFRETKEIEAAYSSIFKAMKSQGFEPLDADVFEQLLRRERIDVNFTPPGHSETCFHLAFATGNTKIIRLFIRAGGNINDPNLIQQLFCSERGFLYSNDNEKIICMQELFNAGLNLRAHTYNTMLESDDFILNSISALFFQFLIDHGLDINAPKFLNTLMDDRVDLAALLLFNGAETEIEEDSPLPLFFMQALAIRNEVWREMVLERLKEVEGLQVVGRDVIRNIIVDSYETLPSEIFVNSSTLRREFLRRCLEKESVRSANPVIAQFKEAFHEFLSAAQLFHRTLDPTQIPQLLHKLNLILENEEFAKHPECFQFLKKFPKLNQIAQELRNFEQQFKSSLIPPRTITCVALDGCIQSIRRHMELSMSRTSRYEPYLESDSLAFRLHWMNEPPLQLDVFDQLRAAHKRNDLAAIMRLIIDNRIDVNQVIPGMNQTFYQWACIESPLEVINLYIEAGGRSNPL